MMSGPLRGTLVLVVVCMALLAGLPAGPEDLPVAHRHLRSHLVVEVPDRVVILQPAPGFPSLPMPVLWTARDLTGPAELPSTLFIHRDASGALHRLDVPPSLAPSLLPYALSSERVYLGE